MDFIILGLILVNFILISFLLFNIKKEENNKFNENIDLKFDKINSKLELLQEQIKLSAIISQNNASVSLKNKKDLDTIEAFIKASMLIDDDDVVH